MKKMKISKSIKTYIRREKQKIRQSGLELDGQREKIAKLYEEIGISKEAKVAKTK